MPEDPSLAKWRAERDRINAARRALRARREREKQDKAKAETKQRGREGK